MASSKALEETLPLEAPEAAHPIVKPTNKWQYSVYYITDLSNSQQQQLLSDLNSNDLGTQTCRFAPGQSHHPSLKEAYDHHIKARDDDETIHPYIFFAADTKDLSTVLVVDVKASSEREDAKFVVGVCRCATKEADLMAVNLDVGNVPWIDHKESEEAKFGGPSVYANKRYFPDDPCEKSEPVKEDLGGPRYAWFSLVRGGKSSMPRVPGQEQKPDLRPSLAALAIERKLEPDSAKKDPINTRYTLAGNVHSYDEPWEQIRRGFAEVCWMDERVDRNLLLVATSIEEDMSIYRARWDAEKELGKFPAFREDVDMRDQQAQRKAVKEIVPELEFVEQVGVDGALERLRRL